MTGDSVWVYDDGPNPLAGVDDTWILAQVNNTTGLTVCAGNPISPTTRRLHFLSPMMTVVPGALVRSMPSQQLRLTLRSAGGADVIAEYVLDHSHSA